MKMNVLGKSVVGLNVRLEWKPEDLWVGLLWRRAPLPLFDPLVFRRYDVWLCLLPCLPLHVIWYREYPR